LPLPLLLLLLLPLLSGDPWDTFRRTLSGRFYVPHFITDAAADLIFKLLQVCGCIACCTVSGLQASSWEAVE